MYYPEGLNAEYNTLFVCYPCNVACLSPFKFQTTIWFRENPWHETIYRVFSDTVILQIWDPVSIYLTTFPSDLLQNLIFLSAVPPPVAKIC